MQNAANPHAASLRWFSNEYYDLNGTHYEVLESPPTALQFLRLAHISRPVLIKGFKVPAATAWTNEYLVERMAARNISVAVTPNGRADAITPGPNGMLYFTEPHVQPMTMASFLYCLTTGKADRNPEVHYLQSQNGNIYSSSFFEDVPAHDVSEFEPLRLDVPNEIPWCSEAFDRLPDAVNLWIGDSRSVTSTHSDPYENIYTVVRGTKHFTLLSPTEGWCLKERKYPKATYTRSSSTSALTLTPAPSSVPSIRWSSIADPHLPDVLPPQAHPIHITVHGGETLYLPPGWWHHVQQSGDVTIALNWWYDVELRGMSWVSLSFLRGVGDVPSGNDEESNNQGVN